MRSAAGLALPLLKSSARVLLGQYELYRVFASPPVLRTPSPPPAGYVFTEVADASAAAASADASIAALAHYAGAQAKAFALVRNGRPACLCWYWYGERYAAERGFWPLRRRQAKLIQITTAPGHRGRGLAPALIEASVGAMRTHGFEQLYARVWRGHTASQTAFTKAGWREIAFVAGCQPFGAARQFRLTVWKRPHESSGQGNRWTVTSSARPRPA